MLAPLPPGSPDEGSLRTWCAQIRASDHGAYRAVFEALHPDLLRYALRFTDNHAAAQDVVQDAFLKLWQIRADLDPARSMKSLLYRIVRNLSLNQNRHEQRMDAIESEADLPPAGGDGSAELLDGAQLSDQLDRWVQGLPPRRREAFLLSRLHDLTHEDIAAVMGLTPTTVNTHIVLALRDLRAYLDRLDVAYRAS
ncbi:MAG: RNA polymerase sigma-70 factor [Bacteroidota bacterium]